MLNIKFNMKKKLSIILFTLALLASCNKDKEILNSLAAYNLSNQSVDYHFGDVLQLPKEVSDNAESISISFGDRETNSLRIDKEFFLLGDNAITFKVITKGGKVLTQDATINVFAKIPEANLFYQIVKEYPHDPKSFVQGFLTEGNTVYESDGQYGQSRILKYTLGRTEPFIFKGQPYDVFSEGCAVVENKIYQLTWKNKKGFIYDKGSLELLSEFSYPRVMEEGWGLTYDGKHLIASDGTKNIYFLNPNDPSKLVKVISVAGYTEAFDQLNELEFYKGFIYANVWHRPIILKINPANGEVVAKLDFSEITKKYTDIDTEHTLNGIAFRDKNLLLTGKNWNKIYELKINGIE